MSMYRCNAKKSVGPVKGVTDDRLSVNARKRDEAGRVYRPGRLVVGDEVVLPRVCRTALSDCCLLAGLRCAVLESTSLYTRSVATGGFPRCSLQHVWTLSATTVIPVNPCPPGAAWKHLAKSGNSSHQVQGPHGIYGIKNNSYRHQHRVTYLFLP